MRPPQACLALLGSAAFLVAVFSLSLDSESLTLTTSYPAPSGVYQSLVTTGQAALARDTGNVIMGANNATVQVGIGTSSPTTKLDVAGGVRMGNEISCDAAHEGTQRYNSTLKRMEYCDATAWRSMFGSLSCTLASGSAWGGLTVTCPAGYTMTGGGVWDQYCAGCGVVSWPNGNGWYTASPSSDMAVAICCKIN